MRLADAEQRQFRLHKHRKHERQGFVAGLLLAGPADEAEIDGFVLVEAGGRETERPLRDHIRCVGVLRVETHVVVAVALLEGQAGGAADLLDGVPERRILEVEAVGLVGVVDVVLDLVAGLPDQLVEGGLDGLVDRLEGDALGGEEDGGFDGRQQVVDAAPDLGVGVGERLAEGGQGEGAGGLEGVAGLVALAKVVVAELFDPMADGGVGGRRGGRVFRPNRRDQKDRENGGERKGFVHAHDLRGVVPAAGQGCYEC